MNCASVIIIHWYNKIYKYILTLVWFRLRPCAAAATSSSFTCTKASDGTLPPKKKTPLWISQQIFSSFLSTHLEENRVFLRDFWFHLQWQLFCACSLTLSRRHQLLGLGPVVLQMDPLIKESVESICRMRVWISILTSKGTVGSPPKRVAPSRKSWNANCVKWWLIKERKG